MDSYTSLSGRSLRSIRLGACLGIAMGFLGCAQPFHAKADRESSHVVGGANALEVKTDNGDVWIHTEPGRTEIGVKARITGAGKTPEEAEERARNAKVQFAIDSASGVAHLTVAFEGDRRSSEGCAFDLLVPGLDRIRVDTGNGGVEIDGARGEVVVDTSNGHVSLSNVFGSAHLETSNGAIELTDVSGSVIARSSNGAVTTRGSAMDLKDFEIETSNGDIELALGANYDGEIDAETSNGGIECRREGAAVTKQRHGGHCSIRLGDGARSRVHTSNGSITIR